MFFKAFARLFRMNSQSVPLPAFEMPPPPPPISEQVLRDLGRVETFPTLSDVTIRVLSLAQSPNATITGIAEVIRQDAVLSVAVLKTANSVMYRGRVPIHEVRDAIVRLGLGGCLQVVTAVGIKGMFRHRTEDGRVACDALFRHALLTATLATRLNAATELGFKGEEYTAGLLHDIGRVIICARNSDAFFQADPMSFDERDSILVQERKVLDTDHCEVGLRFCQANQLPASVAAVVCNHHAVAAEESHRPLVALVALADKLANHIQRERNMSGYVPRKCPGFAALREVVGPRAALSLQATLIPSVLRALRDTRGILKVAGV